MVWLAVASVVYLVGYGFWGWCACGFEFVGFVVCRWGAVRLAEYWFMVILLIVLIFVLLSSFVFICVGGFVVCFGGCVVFLM